MILCYVTGRVEVKVWSVEHISLPLFTSADNTSPLVLLCCALCLFTQSCPTLKTPWTVAHQAPRFMGILQARMMEWVTMPLSRGSSQPRD